RSGSSTRSGTSNKAAKVRLQFQGFMSAPREISPSVVADRGPFKIDCPHMTVWAIHVLNGISFGMLLFLLAAGLSLIYGLMKILNLTHGSYYLLGGYLALAVLRSTGSFLLAIVVATAAIALLGAAMERFFLRRFHLDELAQTLLTFGFLFMFADIALWIWGGNPMSLPKPAWLAGSIEFG